MKKTLLILSSVLIGLVVIFAVVTKTGLIPNYFGITVLCPESDLNSEFEDQQEASEDSDGGINEWMGEPIRKPVIYLYPTQKENVSVSIGYEGDIFVSYPKYNNGWNVTAYPDGKVVNVEDGREYSYLFWEGRESEDITYDMSKGFVIKGEDTADFLQMTLEDIGLTPKEYNEFIVYWLPYMIENKYNIIHFATNSEYADRVKLDVSPKPDSVLRLFMVFKATDEYIEIGAQEIVSFEREGFTIVEWGGTELK